MKKQMRSLLIVGLMAIASTTQAQFIPGGVSSAGLSYVVPDMPVWYTTNQLPGNPFPGYVTNGPVNLNAQVPVTTQANGNWEPYISVVGNTTFLIGSGQFADDGSWDASNPSTNKIGSRPNQRYVVTIQPATGGSPRNGEAFYDDSGAPYRLHVAMRQRNPCVRVAGDKRLGANNFIAGGVAALIYAQTWFGVNYFNTDGRYDTSYPLYGTGFGSQCNQDCAGNPPGTTDFQSVAVQNYSLNTTTLAQTPLTKAFDATYALSWRTSTPTQLCNNAGLPCGGVGGATDNVGYFGGELAALDNGNFVVVADDYTGFFVPSRIGSASAVATIIKPDGTIVKDTFLVDPREIWSNVAAYRGGFCVRVQSLLHFYDNAGNPTATNTVASGTVSGGGAFDQGRGDGTRIASDIRSHYVYLAGPIAIPGGVGVGVAVWDGLTGAFVTNAIVCSDLDPASTTADRTGLAVDASDRVCVAFNGKADKNAGFQDQIIARVLKLNGSSLTPVTPSFFPFVSADTNSGAILGFKTTNPNVAMTTKHICIAAKGIINSTNNPAGGPDTSTETTVYTVITTPLGGAATAGLSYIVPDMPVWYTTNQLPGNPFPGYVTNGPVNLNAQVPVTTQANGNWEPYISVVGNTTFLVGSGQFADDGSWDASNPSTNKIGSRPNQRYVVTIQPATGGSPRNGEAFYDDFGAPYRLHVAMRQRNPCVRVAGDKRIGANNFIAGGVAALIYAQTWFGVNYFNTDGRYNTSYPLYGTGFGSQCNQDCAGTPPGTTDFQSVSVQNYSLNTTTLAQTPLTKAFDATYALSWRNGTPTELCNNAGLPCGGVGGSTDNVGYFGGELAALDNGNFVVVVDDYTGFFVPSRIGSASAVATIIRPDGSIVKDTFLVDPREIWSNVAAYRGGFCVRVQSLLYFFDNAGNPIATNTVASGTVAGGGAFDQGRGDGTRIASDIRSHYVYLAGPIAIPGGVGVGVAVWDGLTGAFKANAIVCSDLNPASTSADRTGLAVDASDRVCVAFNGKADKNVGGIQDQIIARVLKFNGSSVTPVTPSFFPFVSADHTDTIAANGVLGYKTTNPNVAMTTEHICIAAKGIINSTNNPAGGADTSTETTVYTVLSHPDPTPTMTATRSGGNLVISWYAADGLFRLQSTSALPGGWADVSPQPAVVQAGNQFTMTVPIGPGPKFFRLAR